MAEWEKELCGVLEEEAGICRQLDALARRKVPALKAGNLAQIDAVTGRERPLIRRLAWLETRRGDLLRADSLAGKPLGEIAGLARGPQAQTLRALLPELSQICARLRKSSRFNGDLTRAHLEWSDHFLRAMAPARQMYDSRGEESRAGRPLGLVDRTI